MTLFGLLLLFASAVHADAPDYMTLLKKFRAAGVMNYCGVAPGVQFQAPPAGVSHVVMVMRHGDRSSWGWYHDPAAPAGRLSCFPGDAAVWQCDDATHNEFVGMKHSATVEAPWLYRRVYLKGRNVQAGTCAQGVLSNRGIQQQITNGHNIRAAYIPGVLPDNWESVGSDAFFLRSTNVPRTIQSGDSMFYGVYGNHTRFASSKAIPVIDLHTMDETMDNMTPNPNICPGLVRNANAATSSPAWRAFETQYLNPLVQEVASAINYPNLTADDLNNLLDCSRAHLCHGKPIHPNVTVSLLERMAAANAFAYQYSFTYPSWDAGARVNIGTIFQDIHDEIETGAPLGRVFSLFSGHDTTVLPMLMALNVTNALWPPYAATLIFEVTRDANSQPTHVRALYLGQPLQVPFCAQIVCKWAEFQTFVGVVQPTAKDCAP
jgi:lysophosphatidic acid phosphatase type 6